MKKQIINSAFIFMAASLICLPSFAASPGSLDPGFGVAGKVVSNFAGNNVLNDVAVQNDGKIMSVGNDGNFNFLVVRRLANGSLDTSFGNGGADGFVTTDFGSTDRATTVEIQYDGKIVICGTVNTNNSGIARYNNNGSLDTTFDGDGKQTINNVACNGLALQTDGKIVGVGHSANIDPVVFRLNQNGTFDTTFGTNGFTSITGIGTGNGFRDVGVQRDGKIIAAGVTNNGTQATIARFNPNGLLDTTFGTNGFTRINATSSFVSIMVEPTDDSIHALAEVSQNINGFFGIFVARVNSGGGVVVSGTVSFPNQIIAGDILRTTDNKILVTYRDNFQSQIRILRLNVVLIRDSTFGVSGILNTGVSSAFSQPLAAFSGDKMVIGSTAIAANASEQFQITRHNLSNTPTASSDFDGDSVTDVAVFRPSTGNWFILRSTDNSFVSFQFGLNGDVPIDGDFDGDGRGDLAIYRPSNGVWFFQRSSDNSAFGATFGISTDKPVPGDYDKDGKTDIAVFRPNSGTWFGLKSSSNFVTLFVNNFGQNGDIPISSETK